MNYTLESMQDAHGPSVMAIFNHYIKDGFSAYFEEMLPEIFFVELLKMVKNYPAVVAVDENGDVVAFAFTREFHPASSFKRTAEMIYYVHPRHIGQGLGLLMLDYLVDKSRQIGVDNLVASGSSRNEARLDFYLKNGFSERGRFLNAGRKFGQNFDLVLLQRPL